MYCKNCGKYLENDAVYCDDCLKEINNESACEQNAQVDMGKVTDGLGKAIAGGVLGTVGLVLSILAFIFCVSAFIIAVELGYNEEYYNCYWLCITYAIACLPGLILGLIFGIKSIKLFFNAKRLGKKKPFPALFVGIESIACAACIGLLLLLTLVFFSFL